MEHVREAGEHGRLFLLAWNIALRPSGHTHWDRLVPPGGWNVFLFALVLLVTHMPYSFLSFIESEHLHPVGSGAWYKLQ